MSTVADKGNYRGYYKFRGDADKRTSLFTKEWFENKVCLDVGCNEGLVTLEIARNFSPKSILGIDVDKILIESAQSKLKRIVYEHKSKVTTANTTSTSSASSGKTIIPPPSSLFKPRSIIQKQITQPKSSAIRSNLFASNRNLGTVSNATNETFPHNIQFVCKSFMDLSGAASSSSSSVSVVEGRYDTVLCLSVVKWIHLNEGDAGLMSFFHKLFQLVKGNGLVVFEFQPWKSYLNNKAASERIKANFGSIQIRPEQFADLLTREVGFVLEGNIGTPLEAAKGFDRPIFVLRRPSSAVSVGGEAEMSVAAEDGSDMQCEEPVGAAAIAAPAGTSTASFAPVGVPRNVSGNSRKRKLDCATNG